MAGRIPQHFIDDLLTRVDIIDIIDSRVKLKKTGRNYSACCPFHKEKTPSFSVSPEKQFYYCFGCGASGNVLGFIMEFDHLDFPAAIDDLAGQLGLEVPREQDCNQSERPNYTNLYNIMEQAAEFFQQQLRHSERSSQAIQYLKHRGLTGELAHQFGIGYAPSGWNNLQNYFGNNREKEQDLVQSGLLVENENNKRTYDRFRDRVMFPIRDRRGRVIAFGGRVLGDDKPKYLNSPETPIFQKSKELYGLYEAKKATRSLTQIIVVEGYMDVVALTQQGLTNSVATLGTATTKDHTQILFKTCHEILFCFDGDDAGRRAAWRALESTLAYMEDGRQARFLFLPQGEDPDSMVRKEGSDAFKARLQSDALSLDAFLFKELGNNLDLNAMDGRARLAKLARPHIDLLPKGVFKQLVLQKLSSLTGLEAEYFTKHLSVEDAPKVTESTSRSVNMGSQHDTYEVGSPHFTPRPFSQNSRPTPSPLMEARRKPASKINSAGYAIRQLLLNTRLADNVDNIKDLRQHNSQDNLLLVKVLEILQRTPGLSPITLIAQEHDTKTGQRLQELAIFDLGMTANEKEFHDTLDHIRIQAQKNDQKHIEETLKKELSVTSISQVNAQQRRELQHFFDQKRQQFRVVRDDIKKK
ncbi:MAG: DNA primase [Candidatus Endonucleobacter bathymodioli]|uniref:DNA primase n=1 Tax=Candidatus Endonucleibacter bathymodioli TaxID=539814 RepID=A0AA90NWX5_9GAMM|nr:DNA primase [Candidatus Endonucleobacter bathymodioli]